jgi:hypothetical protein
MQKAGTASHASLAIAYDRGILAALLMVSFVICTDMLHTHGQKTNKCCHRHSHLRFRGENIFIEVVISAADYPIGVALHRRSRAGGCDFTNVWSFRVPVMVNGMTANRHRCVRQAMPTANYEVVRMKFEDENFRDENNGACRGRPARLTGNAAIDA